MAEEIGVCTPRHLFLFSFFFPVPLHILPCRLAPQLRIDHVVKYGRTKESIVKAVRDMKVDTLVVGSRNVDFISRAFGRR